MFAKKMRLSTTATILTIALWVIWIVPLEGKKYAPEIFGTSGIQWTSAVIVALCIPLAALMALKLLADQKQRKKGFGIFVFACLPLVYNLTMYGIGGTMMTRLNTTLQRFHEWDAELISGLTKRAINEDTVELRAESAGNLYGLFGIQQVWRNAEGELELYSPTTDQQNMWKRTADTLKLKTQTIEMLDDQLKQIPWLFGLYLGSFLLIIFGGMAWYAYKPDRGQDSVSHAPPKPGC